MATESTLSIIKPDAVKKNVIGQIYDRFEKANLKIIAAKMMHLTKKRQEVIQHSLMSKISTEIIQ